MSLVGRIVRGGAAGLIATAVMSVVILGSTWLGLMQLPPPQQITAQAEQRVGLNPGSQPQDAFRVTWLAAHAAYGFVMGALYAVVRPFVPGPPVPGGLLYGLAIWAVSYLKLMPGLGLYPPPREDATNRTVTMIAAHVAYGSVLGETLEVIS